MKLKLFIIGIAVLSLATGCEKKMDRIFEKSPTERLNASVASAYGELQANKDGWLIKYFPSANKEFGGYTLFAKFTSATDVTIEGDRNTTVATSMYTVYPGAGPILTFDTYNAVIHYFCLPGGQYTGIGANESGMKGDFEFLVTKTSADSIVMEGRKTYNKIVMIPIKSTEAATIAASYRAAAAKFQPFSNYKFEVGTESLPASFGNATTKRALSVAGVMYSYRYTPTGLEFYQEYELKGVRFKELKYVEPTGTYSKGYFTNDAGTIKLVPQS
ncbi:hypothetical protein HMPREF0765_1773 [Sphingobacterium spiritivorum ATCC 33300]|uniref:DUF4302 domain-containing protein n=1 Tax=Sphingobacterium spiritivorum ATCC 33300 TaxID=525372 RepID=C2FWR7_SPHSI|nr:DUF4302 domain-containing protein [Sphingobacterium spiritivorum]EEI92681.1 hypothetical protein HMPREF0765_1773 [Sphingobacterium spiritivorum ATCC 33300]QQS94131.1 DUF4302 domain-containing protein [Sphingobacterium spiritivorum]